MIEDLLAFFPYPALAAGVRLDGADGPWPDICRRCKDRDCESRTDETEPTLCKFGVGFQWMAPNLMVGGVVLTDRPQVNTPSASKLRRKGSALHVRSIDLQRIRDRLLAAQDASSRRLDAEKRAADDVVRNSPTFPLTLLNAIRPEIEQALTQTHDYRRFVATIVQNANVWWQLNRPDEAIDVAREPHEIVAIYKAARMMETRLNAVTFLADPELVTDSMATVQIHRLFTKYIKIFEHAAGEKNIQVRIEGGSYGSVRANYDALAVLPMALLDNAIKYSPHGGDIAVTFDEDPHTVSVAISSFGPVIGEDEASRIFEPFYRGRATRASNPGMGLGLGMVGIITEKMAWTRAVRQDRGRNFKGSVWTTFTLRFDRVAT